jgi:magnesium chelatase subunit D
MTGAEDDAPFSPWSDAVLAARLLAVDPFGLGGVRLKARPGPVRDSWLDELRAALPRDAPLRRVPVTVGADRLAGGLDLAATLSAGKPVTTRGLLAEADGGVLLLAMAERTERAAAGMLSQALDDGLVRVERDGLSAAHAARIGVVALDEGIDDEEPPAALLERLAFSIDLDPLAVGDLLDEPDEGLPTAEARIALAAVETPDDVFDALAQVSCALGVHSVRTLVLAHRCARAHAALFARRTVSDIDAGTAARLVLAPAATRLPVPPDDQPDDDEAPPPPPEDGDDANDTNSDRDQGPMDDVVLAEAEAAVPDDLLERLAAAEAMRSQRARAGTAGAVTVAKRRGRPAGTRPGDPARGDRLHILETLRAAAPWQRLRPRPEGRDGPRVAVRKQDFRVIRYRQRSESTTIFVVDASGSAALHRLAEVKGAVALMLAECYVRRDEVALIAFRGEGAEVVLPPTRSLTRAKRALSRLPGGGGTPLAAGLESAFTVADGCRRQGRTPSVVVLTDGRANVARSGETGGAPAQADALAASQPFKAFAVPCIVVDTAPRARRESKALAEALAAVYLPLPHARAKTLADAIQASGG